MGSLMRQAVLGSLHRKVLVGAEGEGAGVVSSRSSARRRTEEDEWQVTMLMLPAPDPLLHLVPMLSRKRCSRQPV